MKKPFLIAWVFILLTQLLNGQTVDITTSKAIQSLHGSYIEKYKTNKIAGWVLLGSGAAVMISSGIVVAAYIRQDFNGTAPVTAETLFIIGTGAALASIPFFIFAKRNKTKAALLLKRESFSFHNKIFYKSNYAAIALRLQL